MGVQASGVHQVKSTVEERAIWRSSHEPHHQPPYRVACDACGKRMWLSGLGLGSHRRHCPGTPSTTEEQS